MKETTIYLIRHAEAEGNLYRRFHGHYDTELTENGLRQLPYLAARFADVPLDAVYSSDLTRAVRTALAVASEKGLPVVRDRRFREVDVGVWEDLTLGDTEHLAPEQCDRFRHDMRHWRVEGAETFEQFTGRFLAALREVAERHAGGAAAIVAHSAVIVNSLRALFPDLTLGASDNTGVSRLRWDGAYHFDYYADNRHLPPEYSSQRARERLQKLGAETGGCDFWFRPYEGEVDWYLRLTDEAVPVAPMAVIQFAMLGERPAGLLQLDPQHGQEDGAGWIDYFALTPRLRGRMLGVQLIGSAVSYYRALGRTALRLQLLPRWQRAAGWLERFGFRPVGDGIYEKSIRVQAP